MVPTDKYTRPQTSSQEVGWITKPLVRINTINFIKVLKQPKPVKHEWKGWYVRVYIGAYIRSLHFIATIYFPFSHPLFVLLIISCPFAIFDNLSLYSLKFVIIIIWVVVLLQIASSICLSILLSCMLASPRYLLCQRPLNESKASNCSYIPESIQSFSCFYIVLSVEPKSYGNRRYAARQKKPILLISAISFSS